MMRACRRRCGYLSMAIFDQIQRGPFKTVDVALNKWGKVEGDAAAFYAESGAPLSKTGMKTMIFSIEDA